MGASSGSSRLTILIAIATFVGFGAWIISQSNEPAPAVLPKTAPTSTPKPEDAPEITSTPKASFTTSPPIGQWYVNKGKGAVTDATRMSVSTPDGERKRILILSCHNGEIAVAIVWNEYIGTDEMSVTTRIGHAEPETATWSAPTDHTATTFHGNPSTFARRLVGQERLYADTTAHDGSPRMTSFDLRGLDVAIAPLREACPF